MLFSSKTGGLNSARNKTPTKPQTTLGTPSKQKKEGAKYESNQKEKTNGKENHAVKYKTKDSFHILQVLEDIYNELDFNQYDIFPLDNIQKAKKNIQNLLLYLGDQPTCRNHKDLLNLYCDNDKSVVCVSCVYKTTEHKTHKVKSLESVQKALDFETIRFQQKTKGLVHQLNQLKDEMDYMTKRIGENYMMISKYTVSIIDESIKELNAMKVEMQKKISLAYRRTTTVINRYNEALELICNHLENSLQKTIVMNPLSKHLLLKQLSFENQLIESLVGKFNQNRILMEQWNRSNQDFEKLVLKKSSSINTRVDSFVVTEF